MHLKISLLKSLFIKDFLDKNVQVVCQIEQKLTIMSGLLFMVFITVKMSYLII